MLSETNLWDTVLSMMGMKGKVLAEFILNSLRMFCLMMNHRSCAEYVLKNEFIKEPAKYEMMQCCVGNGWPNLKDLFLKNQNHTSILYFANMIFFKLHYWNDVSGARDDLIDEFAMTLSKCPEPVVQDCYAIILGEIELGRFLTEEETSDVLSKKDEYFRMLMKKLEPIYCA